MMVYFNDEHLNGDEDAIYVQRWFIVTIFSFIFMFPLSWLRNMSTLSLTSSLSVLAVVVICITVSILAPKESEQIDHSEPLRFINVGVWQAIGTMSFAFVFHHSSLCECISVSLSPVSKCRGI